MPARSLPQGNRRWTGSLWRAGAGVLSAGGALVSILSYSHSVRAAINGNGEPHRTPHWLGLTPSADTAVAIGDSMQLAVTATDERGATLAGLAPAWTSTDEAIAEVDQGGMVVARGPGTATIVVSVGQRLARSRITVRQVASTIRLGDSVLRVAEGERVGLPARVVDPRGNPIGGARVAWASSDSTIAALDSSATVFGISPGAAMLTASFGDLRSALRVEVRPVPASVTLVSGEGQRAPAGRALPTPVTAQIVSRSGRPVSGAAVSFRVDPASGSCQPCSDTSDARGLARTIWTLGGAPGRQHLAIAVEGVSVAPVLSAEADPVPANLRIIAADQSPSGIAGETLAEPVVVRVTDSSGAALGDVPTAWYAPPGGSVEPLGLRTDSLGEARAIVALGPRAGPQRLQLQVGNAGTIPRYPVTLNGRPGDAAAVRSVSGDAQRGTAGASLRRPIVLRAVDRLGNPVPETTLSLAAGAGTVSDTLPRTDSSGVVKVVWTLGTTAGAQRLRARLAPGGPSLDLTASAGPAEPATLSLVDETSGLAARKVRAVAAVVADRYGNPAPNRTVLFRALGGTVTPARVTTDARGRATASWSPGGKRGEGSLSASVAGTRLTDTLGRKASH
jgi:hypothetical protein